MSPDDAVAFRLDEVSHEDGRVVVTGRWSGVRGRRFMRPTLLVGDRPVLATLDDKPWDPRTEPWRASFPWDRDDPPDPADLALSVGPDVTVPVGARSAPSPATRAPRPAATAPAPHRPSGDPERARTAAERERDLALARLAEAERDRDAALRTRARMETAAGDERRAREAAQDALARERDAREGSEGDSSSLRARVADAEADRDEEARRRRRAESERDEARAAAAREESRREAAEAERDRMRGHLNEALVANETLERRLRDDAGAAAPEPVAHAAQEDHPAATVDPAPAPAPVGSDPSDGTEDDAAPLGVRRIPAVRAVADDLLRRPSRGPAVSSFDLWAIRVLGAVTAVCFIALLVTVVTTVFL